MVTPNRPIVVKRVPEVMNGRRSREFYEAVLPILISDRPQIVFDMSKMHHVDSTGISVFLRCICQAAKADGNIKLAGVSSQIAVVFELTRIGTLFEMYENSIVATMSFSSPTTHRPQLFPPARGPTRGNGQLPPTHSLNRAPRGTPNLRISLLPTMPSSVHAHASFLLKIE